MAHKGSREAFDLTAVFFGLPIPIVNFVFFAKEVMNMSTIFFSTTLVLEIIMNLFGQT